MEVDPPSSPSSSTSSASLPTLPATASNFLTLNDDCLMSVFDFLNLDDLCAVADVCSRFQQNARTLFSYSKLKDSYKISYCICGGRYLPETIMRTEKVLRNFGAFITSIDVEVWHHYCVIPQNYHISFARLLNRYCSGTVLHELVIQRYAISDGIALLLQPVLPTLRKLEILECLLAKSFVQMLPNWTPELQEIKFVDLMRFKHCVTPNEEQQQCVSIQPKFRKLERMCIERITDDIYEHLIENLVKLSPLLKQIELKSFGYRICESIAEHAPQIENVWYDGGSAKHETYISYFDQMKNMKTLTLCFYTDPKTKMHNHIVFVLEVLRKIVAANIPLEHLDLHGIDIDKKGERFVREISHLKNLKTLRLIDMDNLIPTYFLQICKNLGELTEIFVSKPMKKGKCTFSPNNLLTLIENAEKLRIISYDGVLEREKGCTCINANTFTLLLNVLRRRRDEKHLKIVLSRYTTKMLAPDTLMSAHTDLVTIEGMPPNSMKKNKKTLSVCRHDREIK